MLKNISIKARLVLTMGFMAVMLTVGGAMGVLGLQETNNSLKNVFTNQMPSVDAIQTMMMRLAQARARLSQVAMRPDAPDAEAALARAEVLYKESQTAWQKYLDLPANAEEKKLADAVAVDRKAYLAEAETNLIPALRAKRASEAEDILLVKVTSLYQSLVKSSTALADYQQKLASETYAESQSMYSMFRIVAIGGVLFGLFAVAISAVFLIRAINQPLQEMLGHFDAIANGDLTTKIESKSKNEMGMLMSGLQKMQQRLKETVARVREGSISIGTATTQIAAGNLDLSSRTEQQAASLEETASSMEELTSTVKQNADNARQANQLAVSASAVAQRGGTVVAEVVDTMGSIDASARKIVDIIGVIDGIAFQTNILALNAAVEAARAGEQGRGFAVVAAEVRSLAQRSAAAAKEIKNLIDDSVNKVDEGSKLVASAGTTMKEVVDSVRHVTDIMGEILAASQEQSSGIEQVNTAISQMDQVTQQNAALVEEAAAAAASLKEQAANLTAAVSIFKVSASDDQTQELQPHTIARPLPQPVEKRPIAAPSKAATTPALPSKNNNDDWEEF
ncbi:MAG: methyl-accepting chemotaxis protein [Oxalicibacterium faecigallinarum]|uniref:methyl-accepting chemotaxis protein n=1 Tax=Oxalicibacterium faecigallinarum TaxID=573741 RepID=UPI002806D39A|nr:methyl-accepting chemotaxis protein [Oxalicibacterium faecigallinarum]MDQ7970052.1 methyl-accepting chemotaxis protein [Oxalicibacterium faecigallinarum]